MKYIDALGLCLLWIYLGYTNSECAPSLFGPGCVYQCHCAGAESCDGATGHCGGGRCADQWMGPACQYSNMAYNMFTVSAPQNTDPGRAVDGNIDTCALTYNYKSVAWYVDLDLNQWITWVQIYTVQPETLADLRVYIDRRDGLVTVREECVSNRTSRHGGYLDVHCEQPILGRWVNIVRKGEKPTFLNLCEVRVSGGRNLAVHGRADQSSTWHGPDVINGQLVDYNFTASLAVDGNNSTDFTGGSCTVTGVEQEGECVSGTFNPKWALDLGRTYELQRFVIYNRGDFTIRLRGFYLLVLNGQYQEIYRDRTNSPPDVVHVTAPHNLTGDGIIIRLDGCGILTLCEVEAFGDCLDGFYGLDCNNTCNCRNETEPCNKLTGRCVSGCAEGYTGVDCSQVCPNGTFGVDCNSTCSDHCYGQLCHHVTGACSSGCIPGRQGLTCEQVCREGTFGLACNSTCSAACFGAQCNPVLGHCTRGCTPGRRGPFCLHDCTSGYFGDHCSQTCSSGCQSRDCDVVNGTCVFGCLSGWFGHNCTQEESPRIGLFNQHYAVIGGIVAGAILVMTVIGLIIFVGRRKRSLKREDLDEFAPIDHLRRPKVSHSHTNSVCRAGEEEQGDVTGDDTLSSISQPDEARHDNPYYNDLNTSATTALPVKDFETYMDKWRSNKYHFLDQFQKLPRDFIAPTTVGSLDVNKGRNRYRNIIAYDHCRVVLQQRSKGKVINDYINASYIENFQHEKKFVAAQGPNQAILADFIRMLWELNTENLVMLTNPFEEGRKKCEIYWPEGGEVRHGDVRVKVIEQRVLTHYIIRVLQLVMEGAAPRTVTQYHFTAWPDKGVPDSAWGLVDFRNQVMKGHVTGSGPIVVHCSAGVGRTGTFLALQYLLEQAEAEHELDFYICVWRLRQQRINMVQTLDQYIFLHEAVFIALLMSGATVPTSALLAASNTDDNLELESRILTEYQNLQKCAFPVKEDDLAAGMSEENIDKNRDKRIIPPTSHRPVLHNVSTETNGYVNAVFLPGYKRKHRYILTQTPLLNTAVDFWNLVYEYDVSTIVMLDDVDSFDKNTRIYWPEYETSETFGCFRVVLQSSSMHPQYDMKVLQLLNTTREEPARDIRHVNFTSWSSSLDLPYTPAALLSFIRSAESFIKQSSRPILVHCRNGAERGGLYCVVSTLLERIGEHAEVDLPFVVGELRAIRPQIIPNLAQYSFCYDILKLASKTKAGRANDEATHSCYSENSHHDDVHVYMNDSIDM